MKRIKLLKYIKEKKANWLEKKYIYIVTEIAFSELPNQITEREEWENGL